MDHWETLLATRVTHTNKHKQDDLKLTTKDDDDKVKSLGDRNGDRTLEIVTWQFFFFLRLHAANGRNNFRVAAAHLRLCKLALASQLAIQKQWSSIFPLGQAT